MSARTTAATLLLGCMPCMCRHNERPTKSGAWWVPDGFRAYHLDAQLASGIATLLGRGQRNLTVLDLGAGKGLYVRYLNTVGLRHVTGFEGVRKIENMTSGRIQQREFTVPFEPCVRFDIVYCLEVAEHIPVALEPVFLRNLNCSARDGLIISWAPPGQFGSGHVNLRSRKDVLVRLGALGFVVDHTATRFLTTQATLDWFKANTLALYRRGSASPFSVTPQLMLEARVPPPATDAASTARPLVPSEREIVRSIDHLRAGYAKLEARLDELHLRGRDFLLRQAQEEQLKGLKALKDVREGDGRTRARTSA
jgi:SAM-dependent methyltransferase